MHSDSVVESVETIEESDWRPYRRPAERTTLWRYMDLARFLSLLKDSALHLARADLMHEI